MRAAILAIGSELLGTDRVDTNSLELTEVLQRFGVALTTKMVVGDDIEEIRTALERLASDVELLMVTGGLGPTADDVTREALARATGRSLSEDAAIVDDIRGKFAVLGREMPDVNRRQAQVIAGARIISNPRGTAPGLIVEEGDTTTFLFPGVPRELRGMVVESLVPWLRRRCPSRPRSHRTLRVACLAESTVEERLEPVYREFGPIGVLASPGDVKVRLEAPDDEALERMEGAVRQAVGRAIYGRDEQSLEEVVGGLLRGAGLTIGTAESCTGGWIAQRLTEVAGSSDYFRGGIVAYDNAIKATVLGVDVGTLERCGAVSREVVEAMAAGARRLLATDLAIAVSGVAGPGGGSEEKPVGTVDLALAIGEGGVLYRRLRLPGDRQTVRLLTTQWALEMVRRRLLEDSGRQGTEG